MALIQQLQAQGGIQGGMQPSYAAPSLNGVPSYGTTPSASNLQTPSNNLLPNNQTFGVYNQQNTGGGAATWKNPGLFVCVLLWVCGLVWCTGALNYHTYTRSQNYTSKPASLFKNTKLTPPQTPL